MFTLSEVEPLQGFQQTGDIIRPAFEQDHSVRRMAGELGDQAIGGIEAKGWWLEPGRW